MRKAEKLLEMDAEAFLYYHKLEEALRHIPREAPRQIQEKHFLQIKALALVIMKRLEAFK